MSVQVTDTKILRITFDLEAMSEPNGPMFSFVYTLAPNVIHWLITHLQSATYTIVGSDIADKGVLIIFDQPEDEALFKLTWM